MPTVKIQRALKSFNPCSIKYIQLTIDRHITVPTIVTAMLLYHIYLSYNIVILFLAYLFQYLIYFKAIVYIFISLISLYTCITM